MTRRQLLTIAVLADCLCWAALGFLITYSLGVL